MSAKDVKEYYDQVCNQYMDMKSEIRQLEEDVSNGLVNPDIVENLKATVQPLMTNYQTLSCIMYLLNKPTKKSKQSRYKEMNKKILELAGNRKKEDVLKENQQVLDKIPTLTKE